MYQTCLRRTEHWIVNQLAIASHVSKTRLQSVSTIFRRLRENVEYMAYPHLGMINARTYPSYSASAGSSRTLRVDPLLGLSPT